MAIVLGVTGGVGTGKSTVLKMLAELGAQTVSADEIAHKILLKGNPAYFEVLARFGDGIVAPDGEIHRPALGAIVFEDALARKDLEEIMHPRIIDEIQKRVKKFQKSSSFPGSVLAVEIPLLFECGLQKLVDKVMLVAAEQETQLYRQIKSRRIFREEALSRIQAQMPLEEKIKLADLIVWNEGSLEDLEESVKRIWAEICLL